MVYRIGILWDAEVEWNDETPFQVKDLDKDYAVYTELGREEELELFIAKFEWYSDGSLEKAWRWNGNEWEKVDEEIELDGVFDKFKFDDETRELKKEIAENLPILNDPELEELCKDKLETFCLFPDLVPETMTASKQNAEEMLEKYEKIVFKPRYGFAGKGIEFIESVEEFEGPEDEENYILQRFIEAGRSPVESIEGPHDMRTHVIDGELQEGNYIRVPDEGLLSNIAQGGDQVYIDNSQIPDRAKDIIAEVSERFEQYEPNIFSVDIMFDTEDRPWLVELNSKPGMYYHYPVKEEKYEKPRMKALVKTLRKTVEQGVRR